MLGTVLIIDFSSTYRFFDMSNLRYRYVVPKTFLASVRWGATRRFDADDAERKNSTSIGIDYRNRSVDFIFMLSVLYQTEVSNYNFNQSRLISTIDIHHYKERLGALLAWLTRRAHPQREVLCTIPLRCFQVFVHLEISLSKSLFIPG